MIALSPLERGLAIAAALAAGAWYASGFVPAAQPPEPPQPRPDSYRVLSSFPLSDHETLRLVHVPDFPTGLRCLIYQNSTAPTVTVRCDDDLPRK